jgi:hypothetical protein
MELRQKTEAAMRRPSGTNGHLPLGAVVLLLWVAYNVADGGALLREGARLLHQGRLAALGIYAGVYAAALVGFALLLVHRSLPLRVAAHLFQFFALTLFFAYKRANGFGYGLEDASLFVQWPGSIGEALVAYRGQWLPAAGLSAAVSAGLWRLARPVRIGSRLAPLPFVGALAAAYAIAFLTAGNRLAFPVPAAVLVTTAYATTAGLASGPRIAPDLAAARKPLAPHLVFLVDESVRGDVLEINGFPLETTPFLRELEARGRLMNLGVASSTAVCSSYSNALLLVGTPPSRLPDRAQTIRSWPTLFDWARRAGLRPFFVAGFDFEPARPKHFLLQADLARLEGTVVVPRLHPQRPAYDTDLSLVEAIREIVSGSPSFVYANKAGCHFDYATKYPPERRRFLPEDVPPSSVGRTETRSHYYNCVRWAVDDFFRHFFEELEGQPVIGIYTSDHGQNLGEWTGSAMTHCQSGPAPSNMANVPLFLFATNDELAARLSALLPPDGKGRRSAFEIFPALLELMGYDRAEAGKRYGPSLFEPPAPQPRVFFSGDIFGRGWSFARNVFD